MNAVDVQCSASISNSRTKPNKQKKLTLTTEVGESVIEPCRVAMTAVAGTGTGAGAVVAVVAGAGAGADAGLAGVGIVAAFALSCACTCNKGIR